MKTLHELLNKVTTLTMRLKTEYPELYVYLGEDPITIPSVSDPHMDATILKEYISSLKGMLKSHLKPKSKH
ncbi:hypothetical protein [Bizionia paragorgiae]|jgi:hypothetical protein|uniref:Uncharacterized protein n=1 Tax=Bizionia paragorgiae TaxID=283786 RepID=A0A1H4C5R5_BIZPA|nr:hypothetical protein [Bizionia paragorgiae]MDX1272672.1 hypothetical protein [Bizionia paragorgiae]SEA55795.1 hypothetical protein SAMN04487990_11824 [Bizionia paragorgiae]